MDRIDRERDRMNAMSFAEFCALVRLDPKTAQNRLDSYGDVIPCQIASLIGADVKQVVRRLRQLTGEEGYEAHIPGDLFPECPTPLKLPFAYPRAILQCFGVCAMVMNSTVCIFMHN